uniref:Uncharacterized protein n=1 Tax=Acrobeloides nanus TaxID=290746 RepID=A0A914CCK5_9BILA
MTKGGNKLPQGCTVVLTEKEGSCLGAKLCGDNNGLCPALCPGHNSCIARFNSFPINGSKSTGIHISSCYNSNNTSTTYKSVTGRAQKTAKKGVRLFSHF